MTISLKAGLQLPDSLREPRWVLGIWKALKTLKEEAEPLGIQRDFKWAQPVHPHPGSEFLLQ